MEGNLFIVESPHKAQLIQGFLGNTDFKVVSSKGHIRDLEENDMSIDIADGFKPRYVVPADKKSLVESMRKMAKGAHTVWLASDPDREGEAIAWHLAQTLDLDASKIRRVTYNEITKDAVLEAMKKPRSVDMDLVNAQQARRVLDRLVGFELSPILWRKIRRGLSAGRVQSVTLRLVVDREREIAAFKAEPFYTVTGNFRIAGAALKGTLEEKFSSLEQVRAFLQGSIGAQYKVASVEKKEGKRFPAPPFTTSTLQQEAARKLHFTSSRTMRVAQSLYEKGLITYMRTDSTNLSALAIGTAKKYIIDNLGADYSQPRNFKTKSRGAQEAHEAIRPTFVSTTQINGTADEQKLYSLIWKRTIASQMADALVLNTSIRVASDKGNGLYVIQSAEIVFNGFLKVYMEGTDDTQDDEQNTSLPNICAGEKVECGDIMAECKFTQAPYRYSEQTLIKKMEELGIGRPSTYSPTITTLTKERGYIDVADKEGTPVQVTNLLLHGGTLTEKTKTESVGAEKRKFVPTDVGMLVTDFLTTNFPKVMDYDFTANVEGNFDKIAEGEKTWTDVIGEFYFPFHQKVGVAMANREYSHIERELGVDPADGKMLVAKLGQFGPYVQKGDGSEKLYASLSKGQLIESITLDEAIKLFQLPRTVGTFNDVPVVATKGKYGPYLKYGEKNISLPRGKDPLKISLDDCIALISSSETTTPTRSVITEFKQSGIQVMNGKFGPYIKQNGSNYKIPSGTDATTLTERQCMDIIAAGSPTKKGFRKFTKKK